MRSALVTPALRPRALHPLPRPSTTGTTPTETEEDDRECKLASLSLSVTPEGGLTEARKGRKASRPRLLLHYCLRKQINERQRGISIGAEEGRGGDIVGSTSTNGSYSEARGRVWRHEWGRGEAREGGPPPYLTPPPTPSGISPCFGPGLAAGGVKEILTWAELPGISVQVRRRDFQGDHGKVQARRGDVGGAWGAVSGWRPPLSPFIPEERKGAEEKQGKVRTAPLKSTG
ncbi:hypothetical protein O3P69_001159 [Scylla paramamosain]|uniref:Uncharacterized protein n=1 Tax=Scylla paramamosain TaxID=85552 RepID=A0AAW0UQ51_SCYPA